MSSQAMEGKKSGWFKALLGTLTGLMSGALMMYFSPLLDKVVKPAKPIANFAVEHQGLSVTFHNRSMGSGKARWDFGDGSPLEFVPADQAAVTHAYARPGTYTAKLAISNLLGEENERTVTVELMDEGAPKVIEKPAIVDLYVRPPGKVGEPVYAPATFQFRATADNAQHYVWDFGDNKGIYLGEGMVSHTFESAGTYMVRLAAFNGKERVQEETQVEVWPPPSGMLQLSLLVADEGMQIEERRREAPVSRAVDVHPRRGPATIEQTILATAGFEIASVERKKSSNDNLDKVEWKIAPDRKSLKVIGTVKKIAAPTTAVLNEHLVLMEQRKAKASREPIRVAGMLSAPGQAALRLPPVPDDWADVRRQLRLEVKQGERVLWQGVELPTSVPVGVGGRTYSLSAVMSGGRVEINLSDRIASR